MATSRTELTREQLINEYKITGVNYNDFSFTTSRKSDKIYRATKAHQKYFVGDEIRTHYLTTQVTLTSSETHKNKSIPFSKLVYIWFKGNIPEGYAVDHIDNNPLNNNPDNLRLVTESENRKNRRVWNWSAINPQLLDSLSLEQIRSMIDKIVKIFSENNLVF